MSNITVTLAVNAIVQHRFHVISIARIENLQRQHSNAEHQQKREHDFPYSHGLAVEAVLYRVLTVTQTL
ncbi:MAG: hypothetical protein GY785_24830 [Gammaproteobacteria bacterium]|nr:hypothetical protein [Gammaproteobacteria bacterium]